MVLLNRADGPSAGCADLLTDWLCRLAVFTPADPAYLQLIVQRSLQGQIRSQLKACELDTANA
jgi:hypothetical protein